PWTVRETVKYDEHVAAAAERGLEEELDFWNRVPFAMPSMLVYKNTTVQMAPSEAYLGLLSLRQTFFFALNLHDLPWPEQIIEYLDQCATKVTIKRLTTSPVG